MQAEVKRQAFKKLLVLGPMQLLQRAVIFVKSGAIYQPRNIIAGLVLISGWLVGGTMSCRSRKTSATNATLTTKYNDCEESLQYQTDIANSKKITLDEAVQGVTKSEQLARLLKRDKTFLSLVKKESLVLIDQEPPKWLMDPKGAYTSRVKNWMDAIHQLDDTEIDPETKKLLMWNISEDEMSNKNFSLRNNPNPQEGYQCGRGIMRLSYRQATHLGLTAQPDAPIKEMLQIFPKKQKSLSSEERLPEHLARMKRMRM